MSSAERASKRKATSAPIDVSPSKKELLDENSNLRVIQSVDLLSKLNVSFASESVALVVCLF